MGAWFRWIKRLFNSLINSVAIRSIILPNAASVTITEAGALAYGAWTDIALAATVLVDTLITHLSITAISAAGVFDIDIGSCEGYADAAAVIAGGAPAIAAAHRQEVRVEYLQVTAAGVVIGGRYKLDSPVSIPAGTGIIARVRSVAGGAKTVDVAVECKQGF